MMPARGRPEGRDTQNGPTRRGARDGGSLVELVVAIVIFAVAVLGMVEMSLVANQLGRTGEIHTDMWTVAQLQFEKMRNDDFDSLAAGSDTIRGYPVSWTVAGTEPKTVTLQVTRPDLLGGTAVDSFVVVVADWGNE